MASLDARLARGAGAASVLLERRVAFAPATRPESGAAMMSAPAATKPAATASSGAGSHDGHGGAAVDDGGDNELPVPSRVLFAPSGVVLRWQPPLRPVGPGLVNMGNTCFLNAVLQCLTYTPPLNQYMLSGAHGRECKLPFCMMCELETHMARCASQNGAGGKHAIRPEHLVGKLQHVVKHMRVGRQEDAHEYCRFLIEALQKACLQNLTGLDNRSKETTFVHQAFGGYLRSQVVCQRCKRPSNTFDACLDLSLEIENNSSVERALAAFTKSERLDGDNKYKCSRCNAKVNATKRFTVHEAPNVLTLHLKRFDYRGRKLNNWVSYPERLDLKPYLSQNAQNSASPAVYSLYAVLVHSGHSVHSGHYYCYAKSPAGVWYEMNDQTVSQVSLNKALKQPAYMLFYIRDAPKPVLQPQPPQQQQQAQKRPAPQAETAVKKPRLDSLQPPAAAPVRPSNGVSPAASPAAQPVPVAAQKVDEKKKDEPKTITFGPSGTWVVADRARPSAPSPLPNGSAQQHAKLSKKERKAVRSASAAAAAASTAPDTDDDLGVPISKADLPPPAPQPLPKPAQHAKSVYGSATPSAHDALTATEPAPKKHKLASDTASTKAANGLAAHHHTTPQPSSVPAAKKAVKANGLASHVTSKAPADIPAKPAATTKPSQSSLTPKVSVPKPDRPVDEDAETKAAELARKLQFKSKVPTVFEGAEVGVWDEGEASDKVQERSALLQAMAKVDAKERRARMLDERDMEYDRGRVKKVKKPKPAPIANSDRNPFQSLANQRLSENHNDDFDGDL